MSDPTTPPAPTPAVPVDLTFASFGLKAEVMRGVTEAGFIVPSPIQYQAIPVVLSGQDLIAQAQTGTGKTAAFGLPAMNRLGLQKGVEILVIVPTRELAAQVADELFKLGRFANAKTVSVYGGQSSRRQLEMIDRGANIVVATPGRLLDHLDSKNLRNFSPKTVILDEADEMLDMGFLEDIERIFKHLPGERQTLMFSATMPPLIKRLAEKILKTPVTINLTATTEFKTDIEQFFYVIEEHERADAILRLIDSEEPGKAIVFCRTKRETDDLCNLLLSRGSAARPLHGDMEQDQRQNAIQAFKKGTIDTLVATDVAARGLDVSDVTHVFNFHMPFDQESYVHRIGRTGRAGKKGKAITLTTSYEFQKLRRIQTAIKASFLHGEIPSIGDVHKRQNAKLVKALCKQPVHQGVVELLAELRDEMDVTEVAAKLLSMMLEKRSISGPDRIGLSGQRLEAVLARGRSVGGGTGAGRPPYRGGGGGYRPGGGYGAPRGGFRADQGADGPPRKTYGKGPTPPTDKPMNAKPVRQGGASFDGKVWDGKQWVRK